MNNLVSIDPWFPAWVCFLLGLLFFVLILSEARKKGRYKMLRIVAQSIAGLALMGFFLRPSVKKQMAREFILLLTPGYNPAQADSLLKNEPYLRVFRTEDFTNQSKIQRLSFAAIEEQEENIKYVLGTGIPLPELERIPNRKYTLFAPQLMGMQNLVIPDKIIVNQTNTIKGIFQTTSDTKIVLAGPGGAEDSVQFSQPGLHPIQLSFRPKQTGQFVYELRIINKKDSLLREPVPVSVQEETKLKFLFLQKFPTAETRTLKNYLSENNHAVVLRSQISKSNYIYEYINTDDKNKINRLSAEALNSYDLLFVDAATIQGLSSLEQTELTTAVDRGLGVIIFFNDDQLLNEAWLPLKTIPANSDTIHIHLSNHLHTLPRHKIEVTSVKHIEPILTAGKNILSGSMRMGEGHFGFILLSEIYSLNTSGYPNDYASVWNDLLPKVARAANNQSIRITSGFPIYNEEPMYVEVLADSPELFSDKIKLPLTEDQSVAGLWYGKTWAGPPGWHTFKNKSNDSLSYYIFSKEDWKSLRTNQQILQNSIRVNRHGTTLTREEEHWAAISPVYFFLIYVVGSGFLWVWSKISIPIPRRVTRFGNSVEKE
ncbi:MAG: hypothetical protein JST69_00005 [Bacteroidetes bacterium]|nr:hypothetical protein [Bacteroidota bacterium]